MTPVAYFFIGALAACFGFAMIAHERRLNLAAWGGLAAIWVVGVITAHKAPDSVWIYAAADAAIGLAAFGAYFRTGKKKWLLIWAFLLAGSVAFHAIYELLKAVSPVTGAEATARKASYYIAVNILYLLEIITVSGPGARRLGVGILHILLGPPAPRPARRHRRTGERS